MAQAQAPHRVYSEELARAFQRGHPVANPHPGFRNGQLMRPISIGDVGYIHPAIGDFIRLFNIHLIPGVDGQPMHEGLPGGTDFRPIPLRDVRNVPNKTSVWVSKSVTRKSLGAELSGPFFGGTAQFDSSSERGAILATPDPIDCSDALHVRDYKIHTKENIESWLQFAQDYGHDVELEDLMLITGVDCTTSWATAVFADRKLEAGFGLEVQFANAGVGLQLACQYTWKSTSSALVNTGPDTTRTPAAPTISISPHVPAALFGQPRSSDAVVEPEVERQPSNTVRDQSIFIRHIRAKPRRPWRGLKLEARGEKGDGDSGTDNSDRSEGAGITITDSPERVQYADCLDPALDYILEHSDVGIAIAHYEDLALLSFPELSLGRPVISVEDSIGMLENDSSHTSVTPEVPPEPITVEGNRPISKLVGPVKKDLPQTSQAVPSAPTTVSNSVPVVAPSPSASPFERDLRQRRQYVQEKHEHQPLVYGRPSLAVDVPRKSGTSLYSPETTPRTDRRHLGRTMIVVSNPSPISDSEDEHGDVRPDSRASPVGSAFSPPSKASSPPTSPHAPYLFSPDKKTVILVTSDSNHFATVQITGFQDAGFIKKLVFAELRIQDEDYARYSIYRTDIDSHAISHALSDDELFKLCVEEGDSKGSLRLLVAATPVMAHEPGNQSVSPPLPRMLFHSTLQREPRRIQFQQQPESPSLPRASTDAMPNSQRLGASDDPNNKAEIEPTATLSSSTGSSHTGTYTDTPVAQGTIALCNYLQSERRLSALSWVDTPSLQHSHGSPTWTSTCKIDGQTISTGTGVHKHVARDDAADKALKILRQT